jgi:hypothetical protein
MMDGVCSGDALSRHLPVMDKFSIVTFSSFEMGKEQNTAYLRLITSGSIDRN